jgi:hypothetical protein
MPNIDFPNSPANNDTHTSAGRTWLWNNVYSSWVAFNSTDAGSVYVDTTGDVMTGNLVIQANVDAYYVIANNALKLIGSNTGNRPSGSNGMIYYNTELDEMQWYIGGTWANTQTLAFLTRYEYTLDDGDTQVTGPDDNAATLDYNAQTTSVYLNGFHLLPTTDYLTPNSTHITGLSDIANNDVLQINTWNVINTLTGVPTSTQINTGTGLSGGGDLTTNRTHALDINGLTANSEVNAAADYFAMYDASAAATRKVLITDIGYLDVPVGDPSVWHTCNNRELPQWFPFDQGTGSKQSSDGGGYTFTTGAVSGDYEIYYRRFLVQGTSSGNSTGFDDFNAGQSLIFEFVMATIDTTDVTVRAGFGETASIASADASSVTQAKFRIINTQAAVVHSDGTGAVTATNETISNQTDVNTYRIEWIPGTSVIFSVNGTVLSTATTNIPLTSDAGKIRFALGVETNTTGAKACLFGPDPQIWVKKT